MPNLAAATNCELPATLKRLFYKPLATNEENAGDVWGQMLLNLE